jgi:hypothetical protein
MQSEPESALSTAPAVRPRRRSGLTPLLEVEVRAFAEAFFSTDDGPPSAAHLDYTLDELGQLLGHAGLRARMLFRASVLTMAFLVPPVLLLRFRRFSRLSLGDRLEALHRSERSPAGLAVFLVRAMTSIVFYEHPEGARAIGWDQRCLIQPGPTEVP